MLDRARGRGLALAALFMANGLAAGGFFARLHDQQRRFDLSDAAMGLAIAGLAVGALVASPLAGRAVDRVGSRGVAVCAGIALGGSWLLPALAVGAPSLFAALLVVGAADSAMDIAMNANGAAHQAEVGRSILHRLHALWSLGMVAGGALGAVASTNDVSLTVHFGLVGAVVAAASASTFRYLVPPGARAAEPGPGDAAPRPAVVALGVLAGATTGAALIEGAAADWSAIQLERLDAGPGAASLGVPAFMAGMFAGRLVGDRLTDRHGAPAVLRGGMLLVAAGIGAGIVSGNALVFAAGLVVAGAGASVYFPLAFTAAARTSGVAPGAGAAAVSLAGRVGFIGEPVLIGLLADATSLRLALAVVVVVGVLLALVAPQVVPPGTPAEVEPGPWEGAR